MSMAGLITDLRENKEWWTVQDSPNNIESETEDAEDYQATPQHVLDSLSRYTVRKNGAYSRSNDVCGLCYCRYSVGDFVVCLPCHHNFHEYCIENWLKWVKPTCPVDKKSVIRQECLKQVESERYQMKIQKLLLKGKTATVSPSPIPIESEVSMEPEDTTVAYPAVGDHRMVSPSDQTRAKRKELRAVVTSPLCKHSRNNRRQEGSRMEEAVKSPDDSSFPCSRKSKQNPTLSSPSPPKPTKSVKNSPPKFNYRDFLKSLDTPWNMPVIISSYRPVDSPAGKTFHDDAVTQNGCRISSPIDFEEPKPFQVMKSRKCLTSGGSRYSKETKGGWVYKNDINACLRRRGVCRKPKTA